MTYWTPEHIKEVLAVFTKMKKDLMKRQLPQEVYEGYVNIFKKMATEIGVFDKEGRILLTQRPEKSTHPAEPFPGMWHLPGVTHNFSETIEDSKKRLILEELGGTISLDSMQLIGSLEETVPHRGLYHSLLFIAYSNGEQVPKGKFFHTDDLPDNLVVYHEEKIIPTMIEQIDRLDTSK